MRLLGGRRNKSLSNKNHNYLTRLITPTTSTGNTPPYLFESDKVVGSSNRFLLILLHLPFSVLIIHCICCRPSHGWIRSSSQYYIQASPWSLKKCQTSTWKLLQNFHPANHRPKFTVFIHKLICFRSSLYPPPTLMLECGSWLNYARYSELKEKNATLASGKMQKLLDSLSCKEADFLRLQRLKLGASDFSTIKVIGKGAFGEVHALSFIHLIFRCDWCKKMILEKSTHSRRSSKVRCWRRNKFEVAVNPMRRV